MDMPPMMMMPMYFFSSTTWNSYLLFKEARMDSTSKFWVALILTFIAGAFTTIFAHISKDWELAYYEARESGRREQRLGYYRWLIGVMVALRMATHYLAMLLAMSYNVPLFIALCIGHGVGFGLYDMAMVSKARRRKLAQTHAIGTGQEPLLSHSEVANGMEGHAMSKPLSPRAQHSCM
mmetsp:Transcript_8543/g.31564  ORF Transcript_8543/g.31564 Transcript_8543/m.31564 type:complete len:179 (-) Transcript_8543:1557-2093(-)